MLEVLGLIEVKKGVNLVVAIKNGNPRLAEKMMVQHLSGIEHDLHC